MPHHLLEDVYWYQQKDARYQATMILSTFLCSRTQEAKNDIKVSILLDIAHGRLLHLTSLAVTVVLRGSRTSTLSLSLFYVTYAVL